MTKPKYGSQNRHSAKDHLPKWMLGFAEEASEILAASPYVTDERLFKKCTPGAVRLYTAFNALNFISGASSLRLLRRLLDRGLAVFHVEFLHAKVVMIDRECFSIGSQNLTVRGRRTNIEASFVAGSGTPATEVKKFFARIHKTARPITRHDIAEMEKLIEPWMTKFKELNSEADRIDQDLEVKRKYREELKKRMRAAFERKRREEQEDAQREAEEQAKQRFEKAKRELALKFRQNAERQSTIEQSERMKRVVSKLRSFIDQSKASSAARLIASVEKKSNNSRTLYGTTKTTTASLLPIDRSQNFDDLLSAIGIQPKKFSRYLLFNAEDGKLGFVRFAKTRWTYFESGLHPSKGVIVGGTSWKVEIEFDWNSSGTLQRNGVAHLRSTYDGSPKIASVGFAFSITGIEFEDLTIATPEQLGPWAFLLKNREIYAEEIEQALKAYLEHHLTRPFKFKRNLRGKQAFEFFGNWNPVTYLIEAHRYKDTAIFSVQRKEPSEKRVLTPK